MDEINELRELFIKLDQQQKLNFIDKLTQLFELREIKCGQQYNNAATEDKLKLLNGSIELRQLIYSLREQSWSTRKNPYDEANTVWSALQQYFDAV